MRSMPEQYTPHETQLEMIKLIIARVCNGDRKEKQHLKHFECKQEHL